MYVHVSLNAKIVWPAVEARNTLMSLAATRSASSLDSLGNRSMLASQNWSSTVNAISRIVQDLVNSLLQLVVADVAVAILLASWRNFF